MNNLTDRIIVNSSWTENHIKHIISGLYNENNKVHNNKKMNSNNSNNSNNTSVTKIYPPCNTTELTKYKDMPKPTSGSGNSDNVSGNVSNIE